jgi:ligand-binding SRPBCC domain-containing protein
MGFIHLTLFIAAPQERVFDLSRSLELHRRSMASYKEELVSRSASGLAQLNETMTWKARHLFKDRTLTSKITQLQRPDFFIDEQIAGDFALLKHEHYFKPVENGTLLIDQFRYEVPHGTVGKWLDRLYLERYMTRLLEQRNQVIRQVAEGNLWTQYINA